MGYQAPDDGELAYNRRQCKFLSRLLVTSLQPFLKVCELRDITALTELLPAISTTLGHILDTTLQATNPLDDYNYSPANSSMVLGLCLKAFASPKKITWSEQLKPQSAIVDISIRWGWSENVMSGLQSLVEAR